MGLITRRSFLKRAACLGGGVVLSQSPLFGLAQTNVQGSPALEIKPTLVAVKGKDPYAETIRLIQELGGIEAFVRRGDKVGVLVNSPFKNIMVGQGVLRECLLDPGVERVLAVGRSPTAQRDPKLVELICDNFVDYSAIEPQLAGYDACFFCLGVSSIGMDEARYRHLTYDITLAAATTLARLNPGMVFTYVTGRGADSTEQGPQIWARVKGKTENDLLKLPFKAAYMFRPAGIQPLHGVPLQDRLGAGDLCRDLAVAVVSGARCPELHDDIGTAWPRHAQGRPRRLMGMKVWALEPDCALIYITEPARDKGSVTLKRKNEVWNWLPSAQRVIKIPPSMMLQSWMGSDFTNDDLVRQSSVVNDYNHKLIGSEKLNGYDCYKIEMIPKPEAGVVWGKIITWIAKVSYLQVQADYYDEDYVLIKSFIGSKEKKMGGRNILTYWEMIPKDKPGNKTIEAFLFFLREIGAKPRGQP